MNLKIKGTKNEILYLRIQWSKIKFRCKLRASNVENLIKLRFLNEAPLVLGIKGFYLVIFQIIWTLQFSFDGCIIWSFSSNMNFNPR